MRHRFRNGNRFWALVEPNRARERDHFLFGRFEQRKLNLRQQIAGTQIEERTDEVRRDRSNQGDREKAALATSILVGRDHAAVTRA